MRADLHLHSLCSDGKYTPAAVAAKCKEAGLSLFSLTDHDSMEDVPEALSAAKELGISCVPGWEVSAYEDVKVHVLGYGCARGEAYFRFLQERRESALVRAEDMIGKGNEYLGLSVSLKDAFALRARPDAPTYTIFVKIVANEDVLYDGTVTLTSDDMWASEFTSAALSEKGLAQDGLSAGFVNKIGDYENKEIDGEYMYWNFSINGVSSNWGCNQIRCVDGTYLLWEYIASTF